MAAPTHPTPLTAEAANSFWQRFHNPHFVAGYPVTGRQVVFGLLLVFCLTPWASPPVALALGLVLAQTVGNPFVRQSKAATAKLLQYSVVGLGFGMNAHAAVQAGREGILFTVVSIFWVISRGAGWEWSGA